MKARLTMILIFALLAVTAIGFSQGIASAKQGASTASMETFSINPEEIDPEYIAEPDVKIPALTEDEEKMAIDIALGDPRVKELITGKEYEVCAIAVTHTTDLVKIGAAVSICFDKSYETEYDWPFVTSNKEGKLIEDQTFHEKMPVQRLEIFVNFQRGAIVEQISPIPSLGADRVEGR